MIVSDQADERPHADGARSPGRPRDTRCDDAILLAVVELVADLGLTGWSMDAVAARAGVGKATIYRRWPSREALVLDAWQRSVAPLTIPDTGSLHDDVVAQLGEVVDAVTDPAAARSIDALPHLIAAARTDPALAEAYAAYVQSRRLPLRRVLERARERGEIPTAVDIDVLQDALAGPLFYRLLFSGAAVDRVWMHRHVELVLGGITAAAR